MRPLAQRAKAASRALALATTDQKNAALGAMAQAMREFAPVILSANALDVEAAQRSAMGPAFIDRLKLNETRIEAMAAACEAVQALPDPVGEVTESWTRPNGLRVRKVRLPLGVVLMVYESRPNVTSDAAALCLKSGNAVILRGGSEAFHSNQAIARGLAQGLARAGLSRDSIAFVPNTDRESMVELLGLEGLIDLCIPRGGEGLIRFVAQHARVPVVKHYRGVCHVYVDGGADLAMAQAIVVNAKTSRPGVCNAAECLLIDSAVASQFLPAIAKALHGKGVELRACEKSLPLLTVAGIPATPATADDFGKEFLDLVLAIRVVDGLQGAVDHIERYGSEHTEAIVTNDAAAAQRFTHEVCASAVMVNASTRFNDGAELGLGAEVGISTTRLHAFGPMGLRELTAQKYVVEGQGQVR